MIDLNCEVCKKINTWENTETYSETVYFTYGGSVDRNVNHCKDNPECKKGAIIIAKEFRESLSDTIPLDFCPAGFADVVEGPDTCKSVARELKQSGSVIVGWNDQEMTHHDILFTLRPRHFGNIQGGLRPEGYLFVSVIRMGAFAFNLTREAPLMPDYVDGKLGGLGTPVRERLTALINGVMENL